MAIDGAVVYSCRAESAARGWLLRRKLPLVYVDEDRSPGIPSVNIDDRGGARAAAGHLVALGHRRVGIVTTTVAGPTAVVADPAHVDGGHPQGERMAGMLEVLDAAGIRPTVVQAGDNSDDEAEAAARLLLATDPAPTAVLCFSDVLALGVVRTAREQGLTVPGDLSVVGFDDVPAARRSDPPLTTVHQDVAAKGRLAAEALVAAIGRDRTGSRGRARHVTLPAELVVRASTGPPPAGAGAAGEAAVPVTGRRSSS